MAFALVLTRAQCGLEAPPVAVETHVTGGLPGFSIVGLPATAVRESRDRVRAALSICGFKFPDGKVIVNLAPADLPKDGGRFDLPIALGVLAASGQLPTAQLQRREFIGELSLSGEVRGVTASLCASVAAARAGHALIVPAQNGAEAALAGVGEIHLAEHLVGVAGYLQGQGELPLAVTPARPEPGAATGPDLAEVRGQLRGRRLLEVAAAGGHNLLLIGPPGTGKTMLARRLPGLLPPLSADAALAVASIASAAGRPFHGEEWGRRPFRAPHHSASSVALTGGGANPRPGEVTLAHRGVLFLDELPEFGRTALEALRQPLEDGELTISRAAVQRTFPARFLLVAAMNPCPCGYLGDPRNNCRCSAEAVLRYRGRISGPLLDRIDLVVEMPRPAPADLMGPPGEPSAVVRERVLAVRRAGRERQGTANARLAGKTLDAHAFLGAAARALLVRSAERLGLSARAQTRVRRVARTIADMDGCAGIEVRHLAEALASRGWPGR
ncbi:YifB family Mg chelatase-like AAA ATPase [Wenzhouxiangella sp. XN24]|uniref:YifB family Mg chelatase-like AAA ATPase n=1 Tax=Wenzhouxiangella sp. XN24 TaxID=2713569 RepID=UPI0013ECD678|nr:YifB family Mg chelatase-like AAA ATPase [Wenzhouxiangella sp. XN24]NGX17338.1 YifB family Mg chelatase-like AAA ATPase [Wenzhouxiangella sp. XN24]